MSFVRNLIRKFKQRFLKSGIPTAQRLQETGHRGVATGLPDQPASLKARKLSTDEVHHFINSKQVLFVNSSNTAHVTYDIENRRFIWTYLSGEVWEYGNISPFEALAFAKASSKGEWLWSNIRVRGKGNKHKHKKPAKCIKKAIR